VQSTVYQAKSVTLNLIADGDIATTALVRQALVAASAGNVPALFPRTFGYADLVAAPSVFSRFTEPRFGWLPHYIVDHGGHYAYYLDDDFWSLDAAEPLGRHYAQRAVRDSLENFIAAEAVTIVPTESLAAKLRARFPAARVVHIPAHFDFSLLSGDSPRHERGRVVRIGYAGGFRKAEFAMLLPALARILETGKAQLEFIGSMPLELEGVGGVAFFPHLRDYGEYVRFQKSRGWDIGLAPLMESEFSRSKTNNKFREYGALGIAGLYSDAEPYRASVRDGQEGVIVPNTAEAWTQAIAALVDDPPRRRALGSNAHAKVRGSWSLDALAPLWRETLEAARLTPMRSRVSGPTAFAIRAAGGRIRGRYDALRRRARRSTAGP